MLIWIKRIAPFVIIAVALYAYLEISERQARVEAERNHRYALATAKVWVMSAKLRANPEEFIRVRDSLLAADSISATDILDYVKLYQKEPESFSPFSKLVQEFVDSLLDIEDSLALVARDSLKNLQRPTRQPRKLPGSAPVSPP